MFCRCALGVQILNGMVPFPRRPRLSSVITTWSEGAGQVWDQRRVEEAVPEASWEVGGGGEMAAAEGGVGGGEGLVGRLCACALGVERRKERRARCFT